MSRPPLKNLPEVAPRPVKGGGSHRQKPVKLTKKLVDDLQPGTTLYDSTCRNFGVRCQRRDKMYFVSVVEEGRRRWITFGKHGARPSPDGEAWTVELARKEAERLKGQEAVAATRDAIKVAETMNEAIDTFLRQELTQRRPKTVKTYRALLEKYARPAIGTLKLRDVKHAHIRALHHEISQTRPISANRLAAVLSKLFNLAVKDELITRNPVKGLERNPEDKRDRYLTAEELAYISAELADCQEPQSANVVRLLLLTGARLNEALSAPWCQFDLGHGVWTKPSSHTKQKKLHRVPLSPAARSLLVSIREAAEAYAADAGTDAPAFVFPGKDDGPQTTVKKTWHRVRERATVAMWATKTGTLIGRLVGKLTTDGKLPSYDDVVAAANLEQVTPPPGITDVRVHDLRHTYASILASSGFSLPIIGALLGHTQAQTTARYAHLFDDPLREATARVGAVVQAAGEMRDNVVRMRPASR